MSEEVKDPLSVNLEEMIRKAEDMKRCVIHLERFHDKTYSVRVTSDHWDGAEISNLTWSELIAYLHDLGIPRLRKPARRDS